MSASSVRPCAAEVVGKGCDVVGRGDVEPVEADAQPVGRRLALRPVAGGEDDREARRLELAAGLQPDAAIGAGDDNRPAGGDSHGYANSLMKFPVCRSRTACCSSACVFITIGPYQATGSFSGLPETSRKRMPSSPA